jgi:hypothetical protein
MLPVDPLRHMGKIHITSKTKAVLRATKLWLINELRLSLKIYLETGLDSLYLYIWPQRMRATQLSNLLLEWWYSNSYYYHLLVAIYSHCNGALKKINASKLELRPQPMLGGTSPLENNSAQSSNSIAFVFLAWQEITLVIYFFVASNEFQWQFKTELVVWHFTQHVFLSKQQQVSCETYTSYGVQVSVQFMTQVAYNLWNLNKKVRVPS